MNKQLHARLIHLVTIPVLTSILCFAAIPLFDLSRLAGDFRYHAAGSSSSHPLGSKFDPRRDHPKLESVLAELSAASEAQGVLASHPLGSQRGVTVVPGVPIMNGRVRVIVELKSSDDLATQLAGIAESVGGAPEAQYGNLVQVLIPPDALSRLAELPYVKFVRTPLESISLAITSEGVNGTSANAWHAAGIKGDGVKVAVIDQGFDGWRQRQADADLPTSTITAAFRSDSTFEGISAHGTACAEIVYDMAPDAHLYLVSYQTEGELGTAVEWLISQGVQIISFSQGFLNDAGPGDGSGTVNDIVAGARNAGVLWVSAAGDHARQHWEGRFDDPDDNGFHNFVLAGERNAIYLDPSGVSGPRDVYAVLSWDNWPLSNQDYDLLLFKRDVPAPVAWARNRQDGTVPPWERLRYSATLEGWYELAIERVSPAGNAYLELYTSHNELQFQVSSSSLLIPADSASALSVGAVRYDSDLVEGYSSQGPTNGPAPRVKPDIAAPDGVSSATYWPGSFLGTSASAPHVAGAAALVLARYGTLTPNEIQAFLESQAKDVGIPGKDNWFGSGMLDLGIPSSPVLAVSPSSLTFLGEVGSTSLPTSTLQVDNAGTGTLAWTASTAASWVSLDRTYGTASQSMPATIVVSVIPGGLTAGTYDSDIAVWVGADSRTIPVHLTLAPRNQLHLLSLPAVFRSAAAGW